MTWSFRRKSRPCWNISGRLRNKPAWFQKAHAGALPKPVAYFSMEFMLSEALPIYSGGLGHVAGDQIKAASDLGVPLVAVGLLYQRGYFRQVIGRDGAQQALYPYNDPWQLPIVPVRDGSGEWVRFEIPLLSSTVWIRAWRAQIGRVMLYLLDTNDPENAPIHRGITGELYGSGVELRLKQELILGIGGWRLLHLLGIQPEVCHLNEGHAAFATLERARCFMEDQHQPFPVAWVATRPGNLFTTHTPVAAGFDRFTPELMRQYLSGYAQDYLGITFDELLALGRPYPANPDEPFNMAYLAVHGSASINGVSRLHENVSRRILQCLFPRWPEAEIPVGHVTNGVHIPTWASDLADQLWTRACGRNRWVGELETITVELNHISSADLWKMRSLARRALVDYTRRRLARQLADQGAAPEALALARHAFNPDVLTMGFARRFASYKRPNLLLQDPARLTRMLTHAKHPVQLIIAGKAHPADRDGQTLIQEWVSFSKDPKVRPYVIFLSDCEMDLTEQLVQGVDLWINTPRRPWEACGTSGMKTLVNGGLNLSELDGWWAEAYTPDTGWALGDTREHDDHPTWDAVEAEQLYTLLETDIIPAFYGRDPDGIPTAWIARMRSSMTRLVPQFSASRTVREYTEKYYLPCAAAYRQRVTDGGGASAQIVSWRKTLEQQWADLRFGDLTVLNDGARLIFEVQLYLGGIDPGALAIELYADGADGVSAVRQPMKRARALVGAGSGYLYHAEVPATRPAADYTPRAIPVHADLMIPLEVPLILWQR